MAKRTTADRLGKLVKGHRNLKAAMPNIEQTAEIPNGLGDLADRVAGATVFGVDGTAEVTVTSTGSVYKGDMVALTRELARKGDVLRIANGNATMLGAVSLGDVMVICFAQDDDTFLKTAKWSGGEWTLGPTVTMLEGPLEKAVLVPFQYPNQSSGWYLAVAYFEDEVGMVRFYSLNSLNSLTLTYEGEDIWSEEKLVNLCGAWTPWYTTTTTSYIAGTSTCYLTLIGQNTGGDMVLVGLHPSRGYDSENQRYVTHTEISTTKTIQPGNYTGAVIDPDYNGRMEDFTIPIPDPQEYESQAWHLMAKAGCMVLTFPGADGKRYVLEIWLDTHRNFSPSVEFRWEPMACKPLLLEGATACGAGLIGLRNMVGFSNGPLFFTGLARISGPNQKSSLGVEHWLVGEGDKMIPMQFGESDQNYQTNIGLLSACYTNGDGSKAVAGYNADGIYRAVVMYYHKRYLVGGPTVTLCEVGTAAKLENDGTGQMLIYQKEDSIYLQRCEVKEVAASTEDGNMAGALAVTGGRPGQMIKIKAI